MLPGISTRSGGLENARASQCSGEGLVQQRLLQRLQRGVLPGVKAGEALGFDSSHIPGLCFPGKHLVQ